MIRFIGSYDQSAPALTDPVLADMEHLSPADITILAGIPA